MSVHKKHIHFFGGIIGGGDNGDGACRLLNVVVAGTSQLPNIVVDGASRLFNGVVTGAW